MSRTLSSYFTRCLVRVSLVIQSRLNSARDGLAIRPTSSLPPRGLVSNSVGTQSFRKSTSSLKLRSGGTYEYSVWRRAKSRAASEIAT